MSSANCFNLNQSQFLSSGNGLIQERALRKKHMRQEESLTTDILSFLHILFFIEEHIFSITIFDTLPANTYNTDKGKILQPGKASKEQKALKIANFISRNYLQQLTICKRNATCNYSLAR